MKNLTEEQQKEAEELYIRSKLSSTDLLHWDLVRKADAVVEEAYEHQELLKNTCTHPIVARTTENKGYDRSWDGEGSSYWTVHRCSVCDKMWQTNQRWKVVGEKLGMPDDMEARTYDE